MDEPGIFVNRWPATQQEQGTLRSSLQAEELEPFRWFDKMDEAMLKDATRHMFDNQNEYKALGEFMNNGSNIEVPELDRRGLELEWQLRRVSSMWIDFLKALTDENNKTSRLLEDAKVATARQERWWECGNAFSPGTSSIWHDSRSINPPKGIGYADYILGCAHIVNEPKNKDTNQAAWDEDTFLALLEEETSDMHNMDHGGFKAGFNLCVDIKLHILQGPHTTSYYADQSKRMALHAKLDHSLAEMVCHDYEAYPRSREKYYVDAAKRCRSTRERMSRQVCRALDNQVCVYNNLLPLLDLLQRRAYEEIRVKVLHGLSTKLPAELNLYIFEHTLTAEGIPLDPRVFIGARHRTDNTEARKSRLACSHPVRGDTPQDRFHIGTGTNARILACGDDWIETECEFKHHDDEGRREETKKFSIVNYAFDLDGVPEGLRSEGFGDRFRHYW